jgi:hypothetical protein
MHTRKEILEMLSAGEIDVTRATELLNEVRGADTPRAAEEAGAPRATPTPPSSPADNKKGRRWLHIHVSDLESGQNRVRVNVPLGLVNLGLKVGARFTDEVDAAMMEDVMGALQDQEITGTLVEVEDMDDNERVHIFID